MKDLEMKQNVLKEIMSLMDEREGESLKKHPKLIAAKIEVAKPEGSGEALKEKLMGEKSEDAPEESPEMEKKEDGEISAEDIKKLLEHFQGL